MQYQEKPSKIAGITNDYEAFCFDETCTYIANQMNDDNAPNPKWQDGEEGKQKNNSDIIKWMEQHSKTI